MVVLCVSARLVIVICYLSAGEILLILVFLCKVYILVVFTSFTVHGVSKNKTLDISS